MRTLVSVTRRHVDFLYGEGDHQLAPVDDDCVGEDTD